MCGYSKMDGRHPVIVGDAICVNEIPDQVVFNLSQAEMGSSYGRDCPGEAPAVGMKQRPCPEVDTVTVQSVSMMWDRAIR